MNAQIDGQKATPAGAGALVVAEVVSATALSVNERMVLANCDGLEDK